MEANYVFDVDEKVKKLILQCLNELKELKFPLPTSIYFRSSRGTSAYGLCYKGKYLKKYKNYEFVIAINKNLSLEKDIKDTVIHELLHTIDMSSGHKGTWKTWANHINEKTQYNIRRTSRCKLKPSALNDYELKQANKVIATCPVCHKNTSLSKNSIDKRGASSCVCLKCSMYFCKTLPNSPVKNFTEAKKQEFINNISSATPLDKDFVLNALPYLNKTLRNKLIIRLLVAKPELFLSIADSFGFIYTILKTCDKNVKTQIADMYINDQVERLKVMTEREYLAFSGLFALSNEYVQVKKHWESLQKTV